MAILGAHMSIAGGHYKAVDAARAAGCDCVQIFTGPPLQWPTLKTASQFGRLLSKNNNQWLARNIEKHEAERFKQALKAHAVKHPLVHDSYLINLASPDPDLWKKSIDAFVIELRRAELLGIEYVVTHPGAFTTSTEEAGLARVAKALDEVHRQTKGVAAQCLLETTAGQGSCLGHRFEHLATIIDKVRSPDRVGVCVDTCHVFAAGYSMDTPAAYRKTMKSLDQTFGVAKVKAIHVNDSKAKFGSRVDRHAHIGRGEMGLEPFRLLLADRRFKKVPMYLETRKGMEKGQDLDVINLAVLRGLSAS